MFVCMSVWQDISRTTCAIFTKFLCMLPISLCARGLVRLQYNDDRPHRLSEGRGNGSAQHGRSVIYDCIVDSALARLGDSDIVAGYNFGDNSVG